jgi:hypothetical protein
MLRVVSDLDVVAEHRRGRRESSQAAQQRRFPLPLAPTSAMHAATDEAVDAVNPGRRWSWVTCEDDDV